MRVILIAETTQVDSVPGYEPHKPVQVGGGWWQAAAQEADDLAEQAGRLCYLSWDRPNPKTATNRDYLANIIAQQHFSVLEHASATFYIDGVTRNFLVELERHRHLSFSVVSQRYVDVSEFEFVVHPGLEGVVYGDEHEIQQARSLYRRIVERLTADGKSRKEARQAARHVLPGGLETKLLVTGNLRTWREVLGKRLPPSADEEFREVAKLILAHLREIAPNSFQDFDEAEALSAEEWGDTQ